MPRALRAFLICSLLVLSFPAWAADEPATGDRIRIRTTALAVEGTLLARDAIGWRLKLANGEITIPSEYVLGVDVLERAASSVLAPLPELPPVPTAPPKPVLPASAPPVAGPRLRSPSIPWVRYWPAMVGVAVNAGPGATRRTAFRASGRSMSAGFALSGEAAIRFLGIGADVALDRSHTTLIRSGGSGCFRDSAADCYQFADGLDHDTRTVLGSLYVKPHLILGRTRVWLRGGLDVARVEYVYSHGGSSTYGSGTDTASGVSAGVGVDWASKTRRLVFSGSMLAGGPDYREDVDLFGRNWKSDAGPAAGPLRVALGVSWVIGKGAHE